MEAVAWDIARTLLWGIAVLWVLLALPAAIVTLLKRHWLYFCVGWLTLGAVWLIGAAAWAKPDSWWARSSYDDAKQARAADPHQRIRAPGQLAIRTAAALALILAVGLFCSRPSLFIGVDGASLASSVGRDSSDPCKQLSPDRWRCRAPALEESGYNAWYTVHVGNACWTATPVARSERDGHRDGCITVFDHISD
ncbi:MAG TPA: hypothetical protein VNP96_00930 [Solirubrobacterales bacterium]|nr:hypothetical protein [Solirubrobacterales bacterium]